MCLHTCYLLNIYQVFVYICYALAWTQERAPEEERMAVLGDTMRDLIHEVNLSIVVRKV